MADQVRKIKLLVQALELEEEIQLLTKVDNDEPLTDAETDELIRWLGIDIKAWAADFRKRVADADREPK